VVVVVYQIVSVLVEGDIAGECDVGDHTELEDMQRDIQDAEGSARSTLEEYAQDLLATLREDMACSLAEVVDRDMVVQRVALFDMAHRPLALVLPLECL
jgi:DNA primase large subunit